MTMSTSKVTGLSRPLLGARAGDWIEVHGVPGQPPRKGLVLEVLGAGEHEHYRVRWDEEHESLFFPTEGATFTRRAKRG